MIVVNDILKEKGNEFYFVYPQTLTIDALKFMAEKNVGALLVMENNVLCGIFSERDYARKVILLGKSSINTPVMDVMTSTLVVVKKETSINECMQLMTSQHVRHLPVMDGEQVVGVVSIGDVVSRIIREQDNMIKQLEDYIYKG